MLTSTSKSQQLTEQFTEIQDVQTTMVEQPTHTNLKMVLQELTKLKSHLQNQVTKIQSVKQHLKL